MSILLCTLPVAGRTHHGAIGDEDMVHPVEIGRNAWIGRVPCEDRYHRIKISQGHVILSRPEFDRGMPSRIAARRVNG
ncbi:hypothetical protein [Inquilinus sp. CA228]|uniref:hypothetical protein n=1 Tax=Inquilinus sp. CA228 TaxID=3455609 RepID=UPI003F8CFAC4